MSVLEHEEVIYLARLLGNHLSGYNTPLDRIADKLMGYAERTGNWSVDDDKSLLPLKLEIVTHPFYEDRVMFRETE